MPKEWHALIRLAILSLCSGFEIDSEVNTESFRIAYCKLNPISPFAARLLGIFDAERLLRNFVFAPAPSAILLAYKLVTWQDGRMQATKQS